MLGVTLFFVRLHSYLSFIGTNLVQIYNTPSSDLGYNYLFVMCQVKNEKSNMMLIKLEWV